MLSLRKTRLDNGGTVGHNKTHHAALFPISMDSMASWAWCKRS